MGKIFTYILLVLLITLQLTPISSINAQSILGVPVNDKLTQTAVGAAATKETVERGIKFGWDSVAWYAAKLIVKKLTAQTVNYINSGFKGNPAYVTDPGQFFLDTADDVASKLLSDTSLNKLCTPFKASVRLALVKNYISEDENYSCTLTTLKNNYDEFTRDFSQGGWDGWFEVTQNSQNNPFGAYASAQNKLGMQIGTEKNKYEKQLDWGQGFLSFEKCKTRQYGPTETSGLLPATNLGAGTIAPVVNPGDCLEKETVTPGSVINDQLKKVLGSGVDALNAADSINEIFGALVDQLFIKMINGAKGLRGTKPEFPNTRPPKSPNKLPPGVEAVDGAGYVVTNEVEIPAPADALQKHPSEVAKVAEAKANLVATGVDLSGECGAFEITKEAVRLIGGDAGLLHKPSGAGCQGYSFDIIAYPDGYIFDILACGGGDPGCNPPEGNIPSWMPQPCIEEGLTPICPSRYRSGI